jgi:hypothetical protein
MEYWFIKDVIHFLILFKMYFTINPSFLYPRTQYSTIPAFQRSNWGEAPKFSLTHEICNFLWLFMEETARIVLGSSIK